MSSSNAVLFTANVRLFAIVTVAAVLLAARVIEGVVPVSIVAGAAV